ncbi:hypothetical protein NECAME_16279 [Necator americanus]|uniref:G-protein coupled receptors family 1 profile domain-containing protein n=1 Tax=Necator americanus TaxID=51031 RepID=W2TXG6_NECAM|nr:hypothetical protein NECAME_16279 [Necator americanus]ETN86548.1 hypothetical protein NECAME_16279 [Necator americanus]
MGPVPDTKFFCKPLRSGENRYEVGLIVTPLGAWSTVAGEWRFGMTLCDFWISVDVIVFSTATAFYIPLIAIICVYWKIMRAAKKRFKRERDRRTVIRPPNDQGNEKTAPLILKKNKKISLLFICFEALPKTFDSVRSDHSNEI